MIEAWLREATQNLSLQDQKRIQQELNCHFAEAVMAYQDLGLPLEEARTRALHDLGSAADANREFRQVHYTPQESQIMAYWEAYGWIHPQDSRPVQLFKWLLSVLLSIGLMQAMYVFFLENRINVQFAGDLMVPQTLWMVLLFLISPIPWQNFFPRPQAFLLSQFLAAFWVLTTPFVWFSGALWAIGACALVLAVSYGLFSPVIAKSLKMVRI